MRDSWSCGDQKLTDGKTFAQPAHDRRAGWTRRGADRYPIVTLEPLVVQLHGNPSTKIISLPFLTPGLVRASGNGLLYLSQEHYENDVNRRRYAGGLSALPTTNIVEVSRGLGWAVIAMGSIEPEVARSGVLPQ
jgi:hypothetical protein